MVTVGVAPHNVAGFCDGLDQLRATICESGGRVEMAMFNAVAALVQADSERARSLMAGDEKIDALAAEVDRQAVHLIALHRPLADDLREVLAAFKIGGLLVRLGDCARHIARRTDFLGTAPRSDQLTRIAGMAQAVLEMVKRSLDAFTTRDLQAAADVQRMDDTVDAYYASIFASLVEEMAKDPRRITGATHLLVVAQKLERSGDHAVSISRLVEFASLGTDRRPCRDVPVDPDLLSA